MSMRGIQASLALGGLLLCGAWSGAWADERPEESFARGSALLQKADFDGALAALTAAANAAPENETYQREALLVRRVIALRERLTGEADAEAWGRIANSLYGFYQQRKIHGEALALAQRMHERLHSAETAVMLARAQLDLGQDAAATTTLKQLPETQVTPAAKALLGIALARQGRRDEAKAAAESLQLPEAPDAQLLFDAARLRARLGENESALDLLRRSLEQTPPSRLDAARIAARESPDLAPPTSSEAFAVVLKTESQVKESGCSGGASCAKCPSRATCSGESGPTKSQEGACPEHPKDKKPEQP